MSVTARVRAGRGKRAGAWESRGIVLTLWPGAPSGFCSGRGCFVGTLGPLSFAQAAPARRVLQGAGWCGITEGFWGGILWSRSALGWEEAGRVHATTITDTSFTNQVGGNPSVQPITLPAQAGGASP